MSKEVLVYNPYPNYDSLPREASGYMSQINWKVNFNIAYNECVEKWDNEIVDAYLKIKNIKQPLKEKSLEKTISGNFIFDESQVVNPVSFSIHKINKTFAYGFLLPKEVPIYAKVKKGEPSQIVGKRQIRSPAVITSDRNIIEPTAETENKFKIKYVAIPNEQELRVSLSTIECFLKSTNKKVIPLDLFNSLKENGYQKFIYVQNPIWYDIHTLWDIGTYFFQLFNTYPLLELRGLSGTAKSKTMEASRLHSLNPTSIMVNPSEASLFRLTHSNRPTKYIDEAEKLFIFIGGKWISSPVVELINGSYSQGSCVPRLEKEGNTFRMVYYQCYSPTMIGSITGLRDTTETRAITHIMTKAPDGDLRGELEVKDFEKDTIYQQNRNDLYLFALENWSKIESEYQQLKSVEGLKKRDFQLWKPLLAIAKVIDSSLYERVLAFAQKTSEQKRQDFIPEGSLDYKIIKVLGEQVSLFMNPIYLRILSEKLNKDSEKRIAEKTVSSHLDKIGFKEFRKKNKIGSYLEITKDIFDVIISPLIPNYSSSSSDSSSLHIKHGKTDDEQVTNVINKDKDGSLKVTNVMNDDENDEYSEKRDINNKIDFSDLDKEFEHG